MTGTPKARAVRRAMAEAARRIRRSSVVPMADRLPDGAAGVKGSCRSDVVRPGAHEGGSALESLEVLEHSSGGPCVVEAPPDVVEVASPDDWGQQLVLALGEGGDLVVAPDEVVVLAAPGPDELGQLEIDAAEVEVDDA